MLHTYANTGAMKYVVAIHRPQHRRHQGYVVPLGNKIQDSLLSAREAGILTATLWNQKKNV